MPRGPRGAAHRDLNEVYGPVLAITSFSTEDEANGTPYRLSAYVQTNHLKRAHRVAARLPAGSVYVNGRGSPPPAVPFGGYKQSGYGRLGGREGLRPFLQVKNVCVALQRRGGSKVSCGGSPGSAG